MQRNHREAGHQVEIEADQAIERVFRFALGALFVLHHHLGGVLGEGVGQRRDEGVDLLAGVDGGYDVAAVGAQHAALVGHLDVGDALAQVVHGARCDVAPPAVVALFADAADVIVALVHFGEHLADFFRRVLQVGVQGDDALALAMLEAGHDRHVLAEVAVEQHDASDVRALLELLAQDGGGTVAAAVVDEDDLVRNAELVERGIEPVEQGLQALFLVVYRDDDGEFDGVHFLVVSMISLTAEHTRSTSASSIAGNSGSVTVSRPMRSALGKSPSL